MSETVNIDGVDKALCGGYVNIDGTWKKIFENADTTISSDAAAAADIVSPKKAWVNGQLITGSMTNRGTVTKTLDTSTTSYTIPAGKHSGSGKVSITTQTKSATPSTSSQTITPDSGKVLSSVSVAAISFDPVIVGYATANSSGTTLSFTVSTDKIVGLFVCADYMTGVTESGIASMFWLTGVGSTSSFVSHEPNNYDMVRMSCIDNACTVNIGSGSVTLNANSNYCFFSNVEYHIYPIFSA